jgi:hypothetical protein
MPQAASLSSSRKFYSFLFKNYSRNSAPSAEWKSTIRDEGDISVNFDWMKTFWRPAFLLDITWLPSEQIVPLFLFQTKFFFEQWRLENPNSKPGTAQSSPFKKRFHIENGTVSMPHQAIVVGIVPRGSHK